MSIAKPTETQLVKAVLGYLACRGICSWRSNTGAARVGKRLVRFGTPGQADVLGILPQSAAPCDPLACPHPAGRLLAVECKVGSNRPTAAQIAWGEMVRRAGALYLVVRSVQELEALLAEEGYPACHALALVLGEDYR